MTSTNVVVSIDDWSDEAKRRYLDNPWTVIRLVRCPRCGAHRDQPCVGKADPRDYHFDRKTEAVSLVEAHVERLRRIEADRQARHERLMRTVRLLNQLSVSEAASNQTAWRYVQLAMRDGDLVEEGDVTEPDVVAAQRYRIRSL